MKKCQTKEIIYPRKYIKKRRFSGKVMLIDLLVMSEEI